MGWWYRKCWHVEGAFFYRPGAQSINRDWRGMGWFSKFVPPMSLHLLHRGGFFLAFLLSCGFTHAQSALSFLASGGPDSVVVVAFAGDPGQGAPVLGAAWDGIDGAAPQFRWTSREGDAQADLADLIVAGIDQYLDQRVHFTKNGVVTDLPVARLAAGMDRMIALAAARAGAAGTSLSEATRKQLARVCSIDWSKATFGVDGGDDQEKYLAIFYYVRTQRQELERNLRADLSPLQGIHVPAGPVAATGPAGGQVQAPTVCATVFDDDNYLCALDLRVDSTFNLPDARLTDSMLSAIARKAERPEQPAQELKMRKRDRWLKAELDAINQRLDQVDQRKELWALRDRMDDIEGRLDDLSLHVDELDRDRRVPGGSENPLAGLSRLTGRNLAVAFEPGSSELGPLQQQLLSEVVDAMARDAAGRVLLTGQADTTGDPARNMALSERRAKAVRNFLLARGIGPDRVLLNYSGSGAGGAERRVVLEWLR